MRARFIGRPSVIAFASWTGAGIHLPFKKTALTQQLIKLEITIIVQSLKSSNVEFGSYLDDGRHLKKCYLNYFTGGHSKLNNCSNEVFFGRHTLAHFGNASSRTITKVK